MRRPLGWPCAVLLAAALATGCAPDRGAEADELEQAIAAMPGVEDARVVYSNDVSSGTGISIDVDVESASAEDVEAVARSIAAAYDEDFEDYEQGVDFLVPGGRVEYRPVEDEDEVELDPDQVVEDVDRIRGLATALEVAGNGDTTADLRWQRGFRGTELQTSVGGDPASVAAVRKAVADERVRVVLPDREGTGAHWTIDFPFAQSDEASVRRTLARLAPQVREVGITDGHLARLVVDAPAPATARDVLDGLIQQVGASRSRPLMLEWDEDFGKGGRERRFRGSVHVGGCGYGDNWGETEPEKFETDEALALQRALRQAYDAC